MDLPNTITAPDADVVAAELTSARVLDEGRLSQALSDFRAAFPSGDGREFADYLVRQGLLTPYQANVAAAGTASRLNIGPFLLLDPLGESGVGLMYRAVHRGDRGRYTVRVMPLRSLWKCREAKQTVARLAALPLHSSLVPLAEVDTAGGRHYLAWPFVDGESLTRTVDRAPLAADTAARLFADLADALGVCHAAGLTHGFLKPSGVLIGTDRRAKLLDVGLGELLAASTGDESMIDTSSTSHATLGRVDYLPPEAVHDPAARSPAADAYSLGAVMYFAVTGLPPFPDGSVADKLLAHQSQAPLPVRMRNPRVPSAVASVIEQLLAKEPADRPAMYTVRDELRAQAEEAPEQLPLSVAASALHDAAQLLHAFQVRQRTRVEDDTEGAIDFDLPIPAANPTPVPSVARGNGSHAPSATPDSRSPASALALPKPLPRAGEANLPQPRTIVLTATAPSSGPAVVPPPRPAVPASSELPRPVGWQPADTAPGGADSPLRLPVVVPPPPRRRGLVRSLAFWKAAADEVRVSVFGPPEIAPGQRVRFVAYAHLPDVSDNIVTLCRALNKGTELLGVGYLDEALDRGRELTLHLSLASAGVAKSHVTFSWTGQPQSKTFDVFIPWESPPGLTSGNLAVTAGDAQIATVGVQFVILPRGR